jgi:hypothetical protein
MTTMVFWMARLPGNYYQGVFAFALAGIIPWLMT